MVVDPSPGELELSLVALFAGWAMADEVQRRLAADGRPDLRFSDGVVIQHVLAGELTITQLAGRMGVSQQAASKSVADMERRGLLVRVPAPGDARARHLRLTDAGHGAVTAARRLRADLDAELAAAFGAQRTADAQALLAGIVARLGGSEAVRGRRVRPPG
jgi:DNA-binding MarR family transcriptional regulator